jgi:hypothetical protein
VLFPTGGAANAYIPTPEEEEREKKIHEQEAELIRAENQPSSSPLIENKSIATPTPHPTTPLRRRRRLLEK